MKKLSNRLKGFTLIELMIVVAIIGILAAIAIPNFIRYQLRSKTAEARTNMGGIKTNQESFRSTEDNYANVTTVEPAAVTGTVKVAWPENTCTGIMCDRTNTPACVTFACIGYKPAGQVYYQYDSPHMQAAAGTPAEFAIGAMSDLDGDGMTGSFEYQSNNVTMGGMGIVDSPTGACGIIISGEITDCNIGDY